MNESTQRAALESVRKNANDPTVAVGDTVFCGGVYATVTGVKTWAPGMHDASPIRNDWTAIQVITDAGARWRGVEPAPQSGYTHCACRDCMDTTVSSDTNYRYMQPIEAYHERSRLTGQRAAYAYWVHRDRRAAEATDANAEMYGFTFKTLGGIEPGLHAFRLVFTDGTYEELCSYDTVCVALNA